jgi:hypothetical protein
MQIRFRLIPGIILLALLIYLTGCSSDHALKNVAGKPDNPPNFGQRKLVTFDLLKKNFNNPDMIYAPFVFWFWDEPLNQDKMAEMAKIMGSQGFNPGYAHARNSMVGTPSLPREEWLSDKWFNSFDAALKEAEKQHKYLGYCDEYWWPSFQANGRVLKQHPELKAESLNWEITDVSGGTEFKVPDSFFAVAARLVIPGNNDTAMIQSKTLRLIGAGKSFVWEVPQDGKWRIYTFNKYFKSGVDGGAVNSIDGRLAKAFIEIALEPYAKQLGDKMGKSIPGDFIDHEGDYGRKLAWSGTLDSCFKERHKRDIRLTLPLMVNRDTEGLYARARWEWFDIVSDLYAENFQSVTDWHEKRGMYTTAHVWEESIPLQVSTVGDHMKILRAVTMPGQDALGQKALQVHDFKEIESVAEFQNTRATTELMGAGAFGVMGNGGSKGKPWETFTPSFLKQAINSVTAWGMSHIIPHGVFTTRKLTGNPWPPDWYSESPMFPFMHIWTDFARRASYINSMGSIVPDVLLYNPMESAWINSNASLLDEGVWNILEGRLDGNRYHKINKVYADAINDLTNARIEFLVGDRYYLKQMKVKQGMLVLREFAFSTIVLPPLDILTLEAAKRIVDFAKSGGRVYSLGELPFASAENGMNDPKMIKLMDVLKLLPTFTSCPENLKPLISRSAPGLESTVQFISASFPVLQQHRRIAGKDFFWLANNGNQKQICELNIRGVHGGASVWDCETGEIRPISSADVDNGSNIKLSFKPLEAYWLVFDRDTQVNAINEKPEFRNLMTISGTWKVTYDSSVQPQMEFPLVPPAKFLAGVEKPLEDWRIWGLQKFSGLLEYSRSISLEKIEKSMFLDLGTVYHVAEVWVNGQPVGAKLWGPYVFDISGAVKPGRNEIRIRIANLINNSYDDIQGSGLLGPVQIMGLVK